MANQSHNQNLKEGLVHFLTLLGDLIVLNFFWLLCSIPIMTIGCSTYALVDTTFKIIKDIQTPVAKTFFKSFKSNFFINFMIGSLSILVLVVIVVDALYAISLEGFQQYLFVFITSVLLLFFLIINTHIYPLLSRYNNTINEHLKNCFKLAFVCPLETLAIWVIFFLPVLIALFVPIIILYMGWFIILFFISLPVYICCKIENVVFKKIGNKGVKTDE